MHVSRSETSIHTHSKPERASEPQVRNALGLTIVYVSRIISVHLRYCEKSIRGETLGCYGKANVLL